jgi:hypothetical protein
VAKKSDENQPKTELAQGDRVRRIGAAGPLGTVQKIRTETVRQSIKVDGAEPPGITVTVLWDNGTKSHFVPSGLEKA